MSGKYYSIRRGFSQIHLLTNRDIRFLEAGDLDRPVGDFMTRAPLITAPVGITLEEAKAILQRHRIEKLPLVDGAGVLQGLITVKDILKARQYPHAARDAQGRLLVGAAVGVGDDLRWGSGRGLSVRRASWPGRGCRH